MFFISYTTAQFLHSDWWIALSIYDVTLPDQPAVCLFFPPLWTMSNRPLTEFSTPRRSLLHNPLLFEELLILASWKVTYLVYLFFSPYKDNCGLFEAVVWTTYGLLAVRQPTGWYHCFLRGCRLSMGNVGDFIPTRPTRCKLLPL